MRKIILLIGVSLLIGLLSQPVKADGGSTCSEAVEIVQDTNHCTFDYSIDYQWFKINVPAGKKLSVSNCGFTTESANLGFYSDCSWNTISYNETSCGISQRTGFVMTDKDTTIYILWSYYGVANFDFVCKITDPLPGEFPQTAFKATEGINNTFSNGQKVWFKYTAEFDCKISIKGLAPNDDGNLSVYDETYTNVVTSSSYPIDSKFFCRKGETYYFYLSYYYETPITWELTAEPNQKLSGKDCNYPVIVKDGLNRVNNDQFDEQWFKYKATENGVVYLSTCDLTDKSTYVTFRTNCSIYGSTSGVRQCGKQMNASYKIDAGDSIYFVWSSNDNAAYDFNFKFTTLSEIPGSSAQNTIAAKTGTNSVSEISVDQWYKIVAPSKSVIHLSTCGLTTEDTYLYLYLGYPGSNYFYDSYSDDDCGQGNQSDLYYKVNKDDTCYIRMRNDYLNNNYDFDIEFLPLRTGADFLDFNIYTSSYDTTNRTIISKSINSTAKTINLVVPQSLDLTDYYYTIYKVSDGAVVRTDLGGIFYNNNERSYSNPVTVKLISEDSSKIDTWTITVTNDSKLSSDKKFYYFHFYNEISTVIDTVEHTITTLMPYGQYITNINPYFTISANATAKRGSTVLLSGDDYYDYTEADTVTITAEDGTTQDWAIIVTNEAPPAGGSCETALTPASGKNDFLRNDYVYYKFIAPKKGLYSLVNYSDDYSSFIIRKDSCDSYDYNYYYPAFGDSIVFARNAGETVIIRVDINSGYWSLNTLPVSKEKEILTYRLYENETTIIDPVNHKIDISVDASVLGNYLYSYFTLSEGATAKIGTTVQDGSGYVDYSTAVVFTITAQDGTSQDWTVTLTKLPALTGKDFISFAVPAQKEEAIIDPEKATIKISVADTTTLSNIVPYFILSKSAEAYISTNQQYSGSSEVDFTNPVTYKVTAEDNSSKNWVVTLVKGAVSNSAANVIAFHLPTESSCLIDTALQTINISIRSTTLSNQVASFTISHGATVKIGAVSQVSGTTVNDFTSPKVYAVTSEDGSSTKNWTVTVAKAKNNEAEILTYSILGSNGVVNDISGTINVVVPTGTSLSSLTASFTISASAAAKVAGVSQASGTTVNNFTNPVIYTVIAEDGTTKAWTITVTEALIGEAKITSFSCLGNAGLINANTKVIKVYVSPDINLASVITQFTLSTGAVAIVNGVTQVSGVTKNNFTDTVEYIITSQDGMVTNTYYVILKKSLDIPELAFDIQLYPNPASDYINLKFIGTTGKIKVELVNMLGGIVLAKMYNAENNSLQINLSNIKNGAYYLRIMNNNSVITRKIEIVR